MSKESLYQRYLRAGCELFNIYDTAFKEIESDSELRNKYVYCDDWVRSDMITDSPFLNQLVGDDHSLKRSLSSRLYKFCKRSYFKILRLLNLFRLAIKKSPAPERKDYILFDNAMRGGERRAELIGSQLEAEVVLETLKVDFTSGVRSGNHFASVITIPVLFRSLCLAISIKLGKTQKKFVPISLLSIFLGVVHRKCIYDYLRLSETKEVFLVGSLNNPYVRRICEACSLLGIKSHLLIMRTIHSHSIPMLAGLKNADEGLPDCVYVKNQYSYNVLKDHLQGKNLIPPAVVEKKKPDITQISSASKVLVVMGLQVEINHKVLTGLVSVLEKYSEDVELLMKIHPLDDVKNYTSYINSGVSISFERDLDLREAAQQCQGCLSMPSESFVNFPDVDIPFGWLLMSLDIAMLENLFWPEIFGCKVFDEEDLEFFIELVISRTDNPEAQSHRYTCKSEFGSADNSLPWRIKH